MPSLPNTILTTSPLQVFQQQSIELNELAVVADSQNSAILIFTTVTIVFLPLSFLTSYFGMNLQGVVDTSHDEPFFWRICGGFATALLGLVFVTAYKKELRRKTGRVLKGQGSRPWAGGRLVGVGLGGEWRRVKDRRRRGGEREGEV
jgi:cytochrome c biogenesis protein CcdA